MILSFSTKFKNGLPTLFIRKIWVGLVVFKISTLENWDEYMVKHFEQFGCNPDEEPVDVLAKIHTIREDSKNRWRAGMDIHFTVYPRSKKMFRFAPVVKCVSVQDIEIIHTPGHNEYRVLVDGFPASLEMVRAIAQNDGFNTLRDFLDFFDNGFTGKIIHWTNFKYPQPC